MTPSAIRVASRFLSGATFLAPSAFRKGSTVIPNPEGPSTKKWNKPSLTKATGTVVSRKGNEIQVVWRGADRKALDLLAAYYGYTDKWEAAARGRDLILKHPAEDLLKPEHRIRPLNKKKVQQAVADFVEDVTSFLKDPAGAEFEWYAGATLLDDDPVEAKFGPLTVGQYGDYQQWFDVSGEAGPTAQAIAQELRGMSWNIPTFAGANLEYGESAGDTVEFKPAFKPGRSSFHYVFPVVLKVKVVKAVPGKRGGVRVKIDYA